MVKRKEAAAARPKVSESKVTEPKLAKATMVMVRSKDNELAGLLSKAMEDAIKACMAEGIIDPDAMRQRMLEAREQAEADYNQRASGG